MKLDLTTYMMMAVYGVEDAWIENKFSPKTVKNKTIEQYIVDEFKKDSHKSQAGVESFSHPTNWHYLTSHHEFKTGMTGAAFIKVRNADGSDVGDKHNINDPIQNQGKKAEIILTYAGTNNGNNKVTDWTTNIFDIGLGQGTHYRAALDFYHQALEEARKRGFSEVVLNTVTGHSQGGNYAQRVAIEYNIPQAVVYNVARHTNHASQDTIYGGSGNDAANDKIYGNDGEEV